MTGRFPICFLKLSIPFELVDVNVHPAKLEVRFQNGGQIYSQLLSTVRNKFLTTDLTASAQLSEGRSDRGLRLVARQPQVLPASISLVARHEFHSSQRVAVGLTGRKIRDSPSMSAVKLDLDLR